MESNAEILQKELQFKFDQIEFFKEEKEKSSANISILQSEILNLENQLASEKNKNKNISNFENDLTAQNNKKELMIKNEEIEKLNCSLNEEKFEKETLKLKIEELSMKSSKKFNKEQDFFDEVEKLNEKFEKSFKSEKLNLIQVKNELEKNLTEKIKEQKLKNKQSLDDFDNLQKENKNLQEENKKIQKKNGKLKMKINEKENLLLENGNIIISFQKIAERNQILELKIKKKRNRIEELKKQNIELKSN